MKILNWSAYTYAYTFGQIFEVASASASEASPKMNSRRAAAANYYSGNEYFVINFTQFHCSNCEHFRPAGAKPHSATINYGGVMPRSIYYAAHRMSCQIIPIRLQSGFVPLARTSEPCKGLLTLAMFYNRNFFREFFQKNLHKFTFYMIFFIHVTIQIYVDSKTKRTCNRSIYLNVIIAIEYYNAKQIFAVKVTNEQFELLT